MKRFFCFVFLAYSVVQNATGQLMPGYIVKNSGDTIHGFINVESSIKNSRRCMFTDSSDKVEREYMPGQIELFRIDNGKCFSSADILINGVKSKVFLEWVLKGQVSIFTYTTQGMKSRYFIQSKGDTLVELVNTSVTIEKVPETAVVATDMTVTYEHERKEYIGSLLLAFRNCPSIFPIVRNTPLSEKPLVKISKLYQAKTCPGEKCIEFEDKTRERKTELSISASYMMSTLKANNGVPEKVELATSPGVGIGIAINNLPLVSRKFSITGKVALYHLKFSYDSVFWYTTNKELFSINMVNIPWQINYRFFDGKFSPFISLGPTMNLRFGFKMYDQQTMNYLTAHYLYDSGIQLIEFGYNAGAGLRYNFSDKAGIILKYDYEKDFQFFNTWPGDKSYLKNSYFSFSLFYRIH